mmetsp:Transcript_2595/g.4603  ORF Transcript_2595/g.4603 Transcript_2595/m.4603 type:complete len:232 (-) Transcript_2595:174-869(-)
MCSDLVDVKELVALSRWQLKAGRQREKRVVKIVQQLNRERGVGAAVVDVVIETDETLLFTADAIKTVFETGVVFVDHDEGDVFSAKDGGLVLVLLVLVLADHLHHLGRVLKKTQCDGLRKRDQSWSGDRGRDRRVVVLKVLARNVLGQFDWGLVFFRTVGGNVEDVADELVESEGVQGSAHGADSKGPEFVEVEDFVVVDVHLVKHLGHRLVCLGVDQVVKIRKRKLHVIW